VPKASIAQLAAGTASKPRRHRHGSDLPDAIWAPPLSTVSGPHQLGSGDRHTAISAHDQLTRSNRALFAWSSLVAVLTLVNFVGPQFWDTPEDRIYTYSNAALALLQFGVTLVIVLMIARPGGLRTTLALRPPSSWRRAAAIGLLLIVSMMALLAILDPLLQAGDAQELTPAWDPTRVIPFAINATVIALVAPVVEELWFRGLGFTLLQRFGPSIATVATAVTFALAHGLIELLPIAAPFGLGLAYLRSRTDSVYPGIVVHVLFNALGVSAIVVAS